MFKKAFSQSDFDLSDAFCRNIVKSWLPTQIEGLKVQDNPDKYGVDLIAFIPTENNLYDYMNIELEQKMSWTDDSHWPFPQVRIPFRKLKFVEAGANFFIISKSGNAAMFIPNHIIPKVEFCSTKYSNGEEEAFLVFDAAECFLVDLSSTESQIYGKR